MRFNFKDEARETNDSFAEELARLTTLTTTDVQKLFPRKIDKENFEQLLKIVTASSSRNKRTAAIKDNIDTFAVTLTKLLETFT